MKIPRNPHENNGNHENHRTPCENHEKHENHRNPRENNKNHENIKIRTIIMKLMKTIII